MGNSNSVDAHLENARKTGICSLSKRRLNEFPRDVLKLASSLRTLDVSENKIAKLPAELSGFKNLKHFHCHHNRLAELTESLSQMLKLEVLDASFNNISSLPASLGQLTNLKTLNLSHNAIRSLPDSLCQLRHLDVLDASYNVIETLPEKIGCLNCSELNFDHNRLTELREELSECTRLRTLRAESNRVSLSGVSRRLLADSGVSLLMLDNNAFDHKQLFDLPGYDKYMERYTATKRKLT